MLTAAGPLAAIIARIPVPGRPLPQRAPAAATAGQQSTVPRTSVATDRDDDVHGPRISRDELRVSHSHFWTQAVRSSRMYSDLGNSLLKTILPVEGGPLKFGPGGAWIVMLLHTIVTLQACISQEPQPQNNNLTLRIRAQKIIEGLGFNEGTASDHATWCTSTLNRKP